MKNNIKIVPLAILVFGWSSLNCAPLCACKINTKTVLTPKQEFNISSAVFTGKIIKIVPAKSLVTFQVSKFWKGSVAKTIELNYDSSSCGPNLQPQHEYLVYVRADSVETVLESSFASKDLKELGVGKIPTINDAQKSLQTNTKSSVNNPDNEVLSPNKKSSSSESSSLPIIVATITGSITSIVTYFMIKNRNKQSK
jgi:hypothetical protein